MSKSVKAHSKTSQNIFYEPYLSESDIEQGLKDGLIKGSLRLNPRNYKEAYVSYQKSDIFIFDKDINRALFDDIVIVKLNKKYEWKVLNELLELPNIDVDIDNNSHLTIRNLLKRSPNIFKEKLKWDVNVVDLDNIDDFNAQYGDWWKYFQRTGKVVGILRKMNNRHCVGTLSLPEGNDKVKSLKFIKFCPSDNRFPRLAIPVDTCPTDFLKRPFDYKDSKFIAKVGEWKETDIYPNGEISQCLKDMGVIEQETLKILIEAGFMNHEFDENVINSIPKFDITEADLKYRRDIRDECVISIDPKTARDLDDALHIKRLRELSVDGKVLWEVGIHIADVTYYVTPESDIDKEAAHRSTTVYLVHKAIPMLPKELCENLCSLNPGTDKLSYSVIYKITDDCQIIDSWIGRTIIRTACKLSYEEAQAVLDNPDKSDWQESDFGKIYSPFTTADVTSSILQLNHLAVQMRSDRFNRGALAINQPKLGFILNDDRNCPLGFKMYKLGDSNRLIEEWMLSANQTVAEFLHKHLPETAFLRNHAPPVHQSVNTLNKQLAQIGWGHMSIERGTTNEFQELLQMFLSSDVDYSIMMNLCSKCMQFAQYFCHNGDSDSFEGCQHFALNVPLYTHFTSPIRRYPDMIVHRQLTTILMEMERDNNNIKGDDFIKEKLEWMAPTAQSNQCTVSKLNGLAEWCNKRRKDAKSADDNSIALFYSLFVEKCGPFNENAIVVGLLDKAFDVLLTQCGFIRRVYLNQLDMRDSQFIKKKFKLTIYWNRDQNCTNNSHSSPVTILTMKSCIDLSVISTPESDNSAPKIKYILRNPRCAACQKLNRGEPDQLTDISNLQCDVNVVDEDRLYNILDDI